MKLFTRFLQITGLKLVECHFFSVCGVSGKTCAKLVFLMHWTYIGVNLWRQFFYHSRLFKHPDFVGNVTNLIEMLAPLLCHWTIVLESFYKRRTEEKIEKLMGKIQLKLDYAPRCSIKTLPVVKFLWLFAINSSIYAIVMVMIWHSVGKR
jgi:hypothetical protein